MAGIFLEADKQGGGESTRQSRAAEKHQQQVAQGAATHDYKASGTGGSRRAAARFAFGKGMILDKYPQYVHFDAGMTGNFNFGYAPATKSATDLI